MAEIYGNRWKYLPRQWEEGTPIAGERLSTNGHYTGEHLGTPTQDALGADTTNKNAHYVEDVTIRYGCITQDALDPMDDWVDELKTPDSI